MPSHCCELVAVVLLAKVLSYPVDAAIAAAGLPKTFVSVVIAVIVLLPESLAATKSALVNRLQTASTAHSARPSRASD